jgi:hypothetical protein
MNPADEFDSKGFSITPVVGARTFKVDEDGWLTGPIYRKQRWVDGENVATCQKHHNPWPMLYYINGKMQQFVAPDPPEPAPHPLTTCRHGFYAYVAGSNDYHNHGEIFGVIQGYGEVMIGLRGFRCMKARIVALHVKSSVGLERAALIAAHYPRVPWFDSFEAMVGAFPPDIGARDE